MSIQFFKEEIIPQKIADREDGHPKLPQLGLIFDSYKGVLHCNGFPSYMREVFEMIECGKLTEFRPIEYIDAISRFGNTQQRWGA